MALPIHLRNTPDEHHKLEIFDHPFMISYMAKWYKPNLYVEYGIRDGPVVSKILPYCKEVWGVDINFYQNDDPKFKFYQMTTRDFAEVLKEKNPIIDMAFIDACHQSDVVVQDFDDLFPYMIDDGLIFLHDTYPMDEQYTNPMYCNDCWKTPSILKEKYGKEIDLLTIPIMPGLTMVRKCKKSPPWV